MFLLKESTIGLGVPLRVPSTASRGVNASLIPYLTGPFGFRVYGFGLDPLSYRTLWV